MKTLAVAFLFGCAAIAQQTQTEGPLTDHRVMELARAGVSEQEIIRIISTAPQIDFVLRPDAAEAMAKAGVTDETIRAMAARENRGTVAGARSFWQAGVPRLARQELQRKAAGVYRSEQ